MSINENRAFTRRQRIILIGFTVSVLLLLVYWIRLVTDSGSNAVTQWRQLNARMINESSARNHAAAILAGKQALELARETFPKDDLRLATAHDNLGEVKRRSGNFEDALPLLLEGLNIRRNLATQPAGALVIPFNNVACLYEDLYMLEEAEKYFTEALDIAEKDFGATDRITATVMRNMSSMYGKMSGKEHLAEKYAAKADKILGPLDEQRASPRL